MTQNKPRGRPNKLRNFPRSAHFVVDAIEGSKSQGISTPRLPARRDPHFERHDLHDYTIVGSANLEKVRFLPIARCG